MGENYLNISIYRYNVYQCKTISNFVWEKLVCLRNKESPMLLREKRLLKDKKKWKVRVGVVHYNLLYFVMFMMIVIRRLSAVEEPIRRLSAVVHVNELNFNQKREVIARYSRMRAPDNLVLAQPIRWEWSQ